jgi:hypothetical protein
MNIFNYVSGLFGVEELKDRKWVNTKVVDSRPPTPPINKWLKNIAAYICLGSAVMYLPLAHAQGLTNVALNKNASQGSQHGSYGPEKVVDGNYSTFNHTKNSNASNWLQIDLGGEFSIKEVLIYNRNCCGKQRVKNVTVMFFDSAGTKVYSRYIPGALDTTSPTSVSFDSPLDGISAVRIDNGVSDYLHLTEVEVMADPTSSIGVGRLTAAEAYEAEDVAPGDISGRHAAVNMSGFRGGRGIDYRGEGYVQWRVNAPKAGRYLLRFGYALSAGQRALNLSIDGSTIERLPFKATGAWSTVRPESHRVTLTAGAHTVRLTTTGASGPNMDYLDVVSETEDETGHTSIDYYGGETPPQGRERFEGNSTFTPTMLFVGDKIVHPTEPTLYAEMQGNGNFVLMDYGDEVFNTMTSKFWMETAGIQESVHHALCQEQASNNEKAVCTRGVAAQIDAQGFRVVDASGMIVWRPDLGDLDKAYTSEGFYLRVARLQSGAGVLQLIRSSNEALNAPGSCCGGKILWDSENGYRPFYKQVTGLFTAIEQAEIAQSPQAPWDMPDHDALVTSDDHSNGQRHTYIHESIKQQSVLHGGDRTHYSDGSWNARSADILYDDPDNPRLGLHVRNNTRRNSIQLYDSPKSLNTLLWESPFTIQSVNTNASLHVTHRGIEIRGYRDDNPSNKQILWSKYPDGSNVDHNYMLTLNKDLLRVELHNMTTNRLRWYASRHTGAEGVTVSSTSSANRHNIAHILRKRMGHVWKHLEHFVEGVAESAAHTVADTNEWQDFKAIFNDATHLKVHAAFADIAKLEDDVESDIGTVLADIGKLMSLMEHLASSTFLNSLNNASGLAKEMWEILSHPKRIADYVHHVADSIKDANNKRKMFTKLLGDPDALETAVETYLENQLDAYSDNLEDKIDNSLQLHRRLDALALDSKATGDGWNTSNCGNVCRLLTKSKKTFFEIDAEGVLNILAANGKFGATHSLNHLQFRVGIRPLPRLVDADADGDLDQSRLQVAVKILDIASLLKLGGDSFVSAGVFTSHDWLIHLRNFRSDGSRIPLSQSALTLFTSTAGALAWGDLNLEDIVKKARSAFSSRKATADANSVASATGHLEMVASDISGEAMSETSEVSGMRNVMSGDMPGAMAAAADAGAGEEAIEVISAGANASTLDVAGQGFNVGSSTASSILGDASVGGVTVEGAMVEGAAAAESGSAGLLQLVGDMFRMTNSVAKLSGNVGLQKVSLVEFLAGGGITFAYNYKQLSTAQIIMIHLAEAGGATILPVVANILTGGTPTEALSTMFDNPVTALNVETMVGSTIADMLIFFGMLNHDTDARSKTSLGVGAFGYLALTGSFSTDRAEFELRPTARGDAPQWTNIGFRKFPRFRIHAQSGVGTTLIGSKVLNFEY